MTEKFNETATDKLSQYFEAIYSEQKTAANLRNEVISHLKRNPLSTYLAFFESYGYHETLNQLSIAKNEALAELEEVRPVKYNSKYTHDTFKALEKLIEDIDTTISLTDKRYNQSVSETLGANLTNFSQREQADTVYIEMPNTVGGAE
jgi:hypothetical protein